MNELTAGHTIEVYSGFHRRWNRGTVHSISRDGRSFLFAPHDEELRPVWIPIGGDADYRVISPAFVKQSSDGRRTTLDTTELSALLLRVQSAFVSGTDMEEIISVREELHILHATILAACNK